jgi:O-antigen ligase
MLNGVIEKTLVKVLAAGSALITVFIVVGPVADPVNISKFLATGTLSFGVAALLIRGSFKSLWSENRVFFAAIALFAALSFISTLTSNVPFVQNFYGEAGRITGFLTYFFLSIFALGSASLSTTEAFKKILFGFFIAGIINLAYGLWAWQVGDFVAWNNIYGNLLGTFGNPNFMGAFLGMFGTAILAFASGPGKSWKIRLVAGLLWVLTFLEIIQTSAVQGLVLITGGVALVGFYLLRSMTKNFKLPAVYMFAVSFVGVVAVAGALQKGPLAAYIYKRSVSLRGNYWQTAVNMGMDHPFTGVGMDAYGTYFREYRTLSAATDMPGPDTISNAAHNVVLDFFAYGGFPLLISYLLIIGLAGIAILKMSKRTKQYDPVFVALASIWICYQVQSIISINQLGLAIWGWMLSGLMIAYERITRAKVVSNAVNTESKKFPKKKTAEPFVAAGLIASGGMAIGLLVSLPPFTADYKYLHAVNGQDLVKLEAALSPNYFNPLNIYKLVNAVDILERSNLPDQAIIYARKAVVFSPLEYDAWKALYRATKSTPDEKALAKQKMIELDPLNKANKELP